METKGNAVPFEEFVPSSDWDQDSDHYYLLVNLPEGFKKGQVRLHINNRGELIASGEKQEIGKKYVGFTQTHKIPKNAITEKITGKLKEGLLRVTIPKRVKQERRCLGMLKDMGKHCFNINDDNIEITIKKTSDYPGIMEYWSSGELENVWEHKGIVITAALAFSLGVLVSHKWRTST